MKNKPVFYPGHHVLADYYGCDVSKINDAAALEALLVRAAEMIGATIVQVQFNAFNPIGVSGVVIISESHLTIHSWPEHGYVAVDFFTCGDMDVEDALNFLKDELMGQEMEVRKLVRGRR